MTASRFTRIEAVLTLAIIFGMTSVIFLSRAIDARRPPSDTSVEEERLYLTAATANRLSLSFKGLVADWYWMRALQYVGRKIMNFDERLPIDNMAQLNLKLLPPLLDGATTLDPHFMEPYQYTAMVLPTINVNEAIRILKRGIEANPSEWRLYHNLGYIYWQQKNFKAASEAYSNGAVIPGAPRWMQAMKARMEDEGGSRETAREIYRRMYEDATDEQVKDMAKKRLMQLDSFDERDALRKIINDYKASTGRCPDSWRAIAPMMRNMRFRLDSSGAPLDPADTPYLFLKEKCDVDLDLKSEVPSK